MPVRRGHRGKRRGLWVPPAPPSFEFGPTNGRDWVIANAVPRDVARPSGAVDVTPGSSIQDALSSGGAGVKLYLRDGLHRITSPVLWSANDQEVALEPGAIVRGSAVLSSWVADGSDFRHDGQTQDFGTPETINGNGLNHDEPLCDVKETFIMDGLHLDHVATRAALAPGKVFFDRAADRVWIRDDPAGHLMEATKSAAGFRAAGSAGRARCVLHGGKIEHFGLQGAHWNSGNGDEFILEDMELAYAKVLVQTGSGNTHQFRHLNLHHGNLYCRSHFHGGSAEVPQGLNFIFERIHQSFGNYRHYGSRPLAYDEGGSKLLGIKNYQSRVIYSHDHDGDGDWFDTDNYGLYEESVLEGSARWGLFWERNWQSGLTTTIRHVYLHGGIDALSPLGTWGKARGGFTIAQSHDVDAHNNLIDLPTGYGLKYRANSTEKCDDNNVHHNLFRYDSIADANTNREIVSCRDTPAGDTGMGVNNQHNFNEYEVANVNEDLFNWPSSNDLKTFSEWQSVNGFDLNGEIRVLS